MDGAADLVLFKNAVQGGAVPDVLLIEGDGLSGDLFHALHGLCGGVDKVVDDYNVVALLQEFDAGMASDVSGAAGNKYGHIGVSFLFD